MDRIALLWMGERLTQIGEELLHLPVPLPVLTVVGPQRVSKASKKSCFRNRHGH